MTKNSTTTLMTMDEDALNRIAAALERMSPMPMDAAEFSTASAFVWHVDPDRLEPVNAVNRVALGELQPDLTFLCMLPPQEGQARLKNRATDRLDQETAAFHQKVYEGYQAMADSGDLRFKVIDATAAPEAMLTAVLGHLKRLEHGLLKYL